MEADERELLDDDFDLDDNAAADAKPCNFFVRTGQCTNGYECRYSHRFSACSVDVQRRVLLGRRANSSNATKSARRTVALVHPGEMGISVAACLLRRGHRVLWCGEGRSSATRLRAESFGLVEMPSLQAMVAEADVVISLVPPADALGMARAVASAWAAVVRAAGVSAKVRGMVPPVYVRAPSVPFLVSPPCQAKQHRNQCICAHHITQPPTRRPACSFVQPRSFCSKWVPGSIYCRARDGTMHARTQPTCAI